MRQPTALLGAKASASTPRLGPPPVRRSTSENRRRRNPPQAANKSPSRAQRTGPTRRRDFQRPLPAPPPPKGPAGGPINRRQRQRRGRGRRKRDDCDCEHALPGQSRGVLWYGPLAQWLEQGTFTGRRRGNPTVVRCKFGERFQLPTPSQARSLCGHVKV